LDHRLFEVSMSGLGIAVFMAARRVGGFGCHPVMRHQRLVVGRELLRVAIVMHRQRHPVGPMPLRYRSQVPDRVLPAGAQAGEALGKAHRDVFPVRVRQHPVINQMVEGHSLDGHLHLVHPGKIGGRQAAGRMLLGKEYFLGRTVLGLPPAHAAFQRAAHGGGILAGIRLL
jgi:hypothetical protein